MNIVLKIVLLYVLAYSAPAMAYIDPGSGSAILSAIVGISVAIGLAIKTYWYKLKSFFTRDKQQHQAPDKDTCSKENEMKQEKK